MMSVQMDASRLREFKELIKHENLRVYEVCELIAEVESLKTELAELCTKHEKLFRSYGNFVLAGTSAKQQLAEVREREIVQRHDIKVMHEGFVELENEIIEQAEELDVQYEAICGMREALRPFVEHSGDVPWWEQFGAEVYEQAVKTFFRSPPCSHKEEAERLKSQMVARDEQNQVTLDQYVKIVGFLQAQLAEERKNAEHWHQEFLLCDKRKKEATLQR